MTTFAAILGLAAQLAGAAWADPCAVSSSEQRMIRATGDRIASLEPVEFFPDRTEAKFSGCGVWRLEISPDGSVAGLSPIRARGSAESRALMEATLRRSRFKPSAASWSGLVRLRLEPEP